MYLRLWFLEIFKAHSVIDRVVYVRELCLNRALRWRNKYCRLQLLSIQHWKRKPYPRNSVVSFSTINHESWSGTCAPLSEFWRISPYYSGLLFDFCVTPQVSTQYDRLNLLITRCSPDLFAVLDRCEWGTFVRITATSCYAPARREGGNKRCFCPSVRLSVAYIAKNSRTRRPIGKVPHLDATCVPVSRSEGQRVARPINADTHRAPIFWMARPIRTSNLVCGWRTTTRISHRS